MKNNEKQGNLRKTQILEPNIPKQIFGRFWGVFR